MRPKDQWVEEQLTDTEPADPHAGCTTLDHLCDECRAGFEADMADMAEEVANLEAAAEQAAARVAAYQTVLTQLAQAERAAS